LAPKCLDTKEVNFERSMQRESAFVPSFHDGCQSS
jgi:hypothetical protein